MKKEDLQFFKKWLSDYCRSFYSHNPGDQMNISLKEKHTFRVCENIIYITKELSLDENKQMIAETIALFHDIGRFPQYAKYKTFRDSISVNHGPLGARTLENEKVLLRLPDNEKEMVIKAVKFHNAFSVPKIEKEEIVFFIRLIRDADKLDIWRVFLEYYESPYESRASAVGLGLPDITEYSKDVISCIYKRQIVSLSNIKTLNDFKILQLSWIFDLNFKPSFKLLSERKYIDKIISYLPKTEEIRRLLLFLKEYMENKLAETR
ncbi:MAG: HD domain-containing protein [Nitrospirae bacterium]|jgi:HD superfamily phosphohydrolase YqeK|nr:HD domain-containing protein [Nitrospirota bacterium]